MRVRVVLVGVEGEVNLGFIARTCKNFAVEELYLVNPVANIEEAIRYSAKASDYLKKAVITDDLGKAISGVDLVAATTAKGYSVGDVVRQAVPLREFVEMIAGKTNSLAVVFGRESTGLTRRELGMADVLVTIPANPEYPVLNLSQAVAVVLWELWNIKGLTAENVPRPADRNDLELILELLKEISKHTIVVDDKIERVMTIWKKIIFRSRIAEYEAKLIIYWLRRVLRKITEK